MNPENVLSIGQVVSRPGRPCVMCVIMPEARHFDRRCGSCLGSIEQQGKWVAHRLSKWPTNMEIDGTTTTKLWLMK